jgi:predicted amidohydrolase YtcJ
LPPVDLVLHNANVLTVNARQPRAELVAVRSGGLAWVGTKDDLGRFEGSPRLVDCGGRTLVPGFIDAHAHILAYAAKLVSVDCSPASVASISDVRDRIGLNAAGLPPGTWLRAGGYDEFRLAERRHPTRRDLDRSVPNHPVKLDHRSLHACVLNSMALALAGVSIETPDPAGGLIDRELDTGEPSGLVFGMNSYLNEVVVPPLSYEELEHGISLANESFLSAGVTSIQDASVGNGLEQWRAFMRLKQSRALAPRLTMMFGIQSLADVADAGLTPGTGDGELRLGAAKLVLDEVSGRLNPCQEEINELVVAAHQAGHQVAMHAVEEGTVEAACAALEHTLRLHPKADHRHRIEHCSVCPPPHLARLRDARAVVVTQPAFVYHSGERYIHDVPESQLPWLYRTRSFLENSLRPAGSSDCPVAPCSSLTGIYAAVTRRAESGQVLSPGEVVSPEEALRLFTLSGAVSSFEEGVKGSIEVGKLADMVLLSRDPTRVGPDEIRDICVEATIVGGEIVWQREGLGYA